MVRETPFKTDTHVAIKGATIQQLKTMTYIIYKI